MVCPGNHVLDGGSESQVYEIFSTQINSKYLPALADASPAQNTVNNVTADSVIMTSHDTIFRRRSHATDRTISSSLNNTGQDHAELCASRLKSKSRPTL